MANPLNRAFFQSESAVIIRGPEVPNASFQDGMNLGGSNAPGIGIGFADPNDPESALPLAGTPPQFTLLDQDGDPRTPQVSQHIGGRGFTLIAAYPGSGGVEGKGVDPIQALIPDAGGTGSGTLNGEATLNTLEEGWVTDGGLAPPENTVAPALSGVPTVDVELTVSDGTWTGEPPITFEYEWFVDDISVQGPSGSNAYTPQVADDGLDLYAIVYATNIVGSDNAQSDTQTVTT